jgi:hypothetical protein
MDDLAAGAAATRLVAAPRFRLAPTLECQCSRVGANLNLGGRLQFKLRVEVLMLDIKDRNHGGRQGAYSADDAARVSSLKRTALLGKCILENAFSGLPVSF